MRALTWEGQFQVPEVVPSGGQRQEVEMVLSVDWPASGPAQQKVAAEPVPCRQKQVLGAQSWTAVMSMPPDGSQALAAAWAVASERVPSGVQEK